MEGHYFLSDLRAVASFGDRMVKLDCFRSERLFAGLNCLKRGQSQRTHTHDGMDKLYVVISGKARIVVGEDRRDVGTGGMAWAPAGAPHGIEEALEDSVLLVVMAPPQSEQSPRG